MGLSNNYNKIERDLLESYSQMIAAMGIPDARKMTEQLLNRAIEESKKEKSYYLPSNFGDILLGEQKTEDPIVKKIVSIMQEKDLPKKRLEGVRDEDIRWWWNMNDIERRMMIMVDNWARLAVFEKEKGEGKTIEQALTKVSKSFPIYGDPEDTRNAQGDDRPLPCELKDRINIYTEKIASSGPEKLEKFKKEVESFSTFNAWVRKEIKADNL